MLSWPMRAMRSRVDVPGVAAASVLPVPQVMEVQVRLTDLRHLVGPLHCLVEVIAAERPPTRPGEDECIGVVGHELVEVSAKPRHDGGR